jgi:hypothetical protein
MLCHSKIAGAPRVAVARGAFDFHPLHPGKRSFKQKIILAKNFSYNFRSHAQIQKFICVDAAHSSAHNPLH